MGLPSYRREDFSWPPARTLTWPLTLEPWQEAIVLDQFPGQCVRGLIHSDGWRGTNSGRGKNGRVYEYTRYQFCNHSDDIRGLFVKGCERLGVETKRMNRYTVAVSTRAAVARLDEFVGPKY